MSRNGAYICGTLRAARKNNPRKVVRRKLGKGEMVWARNETAVVCKWKNKRYMLTISNKYKAELEHVTNRRDKEKMKASTVTDYNLGMSGIDRSDQILPYYQGLRRTVRWYKKIGFHFLEIYMHNAFHLFECHQPQSSTVFIDFLNDAVKSLLQFTGNPCINIDPNVTAHYPSFISKDGNKEKKMLRSRACYKKDVRREIRFKCIKCENQPSLCVAPCFRNFHENNLHLMQ